MVQQKMAPKKSELDCTSNNRVTNLETWALDKYILACDSHGYSLLTEVIDMSVPMQECTFHMTFAVM